MRRRFSVKLITFLRVTKKVLQEETIWLSFGRCVEEEICKTLLKKVSNVVEQKCLSGLFSVIQPVIVGGFCNVKIIYFFFLVLKLYVYGKWVIG